MGVTEFSITFDNNPDGVYPAGSTVSGAVQIVVDVPVTHRGITLKLLGEARVRWTMRVHQYHSAIFSEAETYFDKDFPLVAAEEDSESLELPPGTHSFPFSHDLPSSLPASFEGTSGNVRYSASARIIRATWVPDITATKMFTITTSLDLNRDTQANRAEVSEKSKEDLRYSCCHTGPVSLKASLPRTGYVPGEQMKIVAEVENLTTTEVKLLAILRQVAEFRATTNGCTGERAVTKAGVNRVARATGGTIAPGQTQGWEGEAISVPLIPPTDLGGECTIIGVRYELKVIAKPVGLASKVKVRLPVTIGSVALLDAPEVQDTPAADDATMQDRL